MDAGSSVILNKTSQGGPINFNSPRRRRVQGNYRSRLTRRYITIWRTFSEKSKKRKKNIVPRLASDSAVITEGAKNKWEGGEEGKKKQKQTNSIVVIDYIELYRLFVVLYRNVSYFIVIIIVTYEILYIRVSRYPSLFHRSFYIYIYLCIYRTFLWDRQILLIRS